MKDHWSTPFLLMPVMIMVTIMIIMIIMNIMLNLNNFKILNPLMPDKETETEIETLHPGEVVEEVTVRLSLLTRCQRLVLTEMARDVLTKLR